MLRSRRTALICFLLAAITFALYGPALRGDFLNYDDLDYIFDNPAVRQGVTGEGIVLAFTRFHSGNWHPLTWISHAVDCQIFGLRPWGHHLTNVLFHSANTVLLFLVLLRLVNQSGPSTSNPSNYQPPPSPATPVVTRHSSLVTLQCAFVAALFAWHPLHVESVAWISERKDVLSTFFFLLTIWSYTRYVELRQSQLLNSPTPKLPNSCPHHLLWYILSLLLFMLALLSKPMVVTLPFILLLLDFWPMGRLKLEPRTSNLLLLKEKLPFFLLSAFGCFMTVLAQAGGHAISGSAILPASDRIKNALLSYVEYLAKAFWPTNLAPFYPYHLDLPIAVALGSAALLLGITAVCLRQMRTRPYLIVGWLWFVGTLVPVIGLVQVGAQSRADRYTYIPYIGLFIAVVWVAPGLCSSRRKEALNGAKPGVEKAPPRAALSRQSEKLNTEHWILNTSFLPGLLLASAVLLPLALLTHRQLQFWKNGITLFEHCRTVTGESLFVEFVLGGAYERAGDLDAAIFHYRRTMEIPPNRIEAPRALRIVPQIRVAQILQRQGRWGEAMAEFESLLVRAPARWDLRTSLAGCLAAQGRFAEAAEQYKTVTEANPNSSEIWWRFGICLNSAGRSDEALKAYRQAVQLDSWNPEALNDLAWFLATDPHAELRDGAAAVRLAQKASGLNGEREARFLGTLDAAYAEAGQFDLAIKTAEKTKKMAIEAGQTALAEAAAKRLELYRQNKPYHL